MLLHKMASVHALNHNKESLTTAQYAQNSGFDHVLAKIQQQDIMTLKNKAHAISTVIESSQSQQYQENLQVRLETLQQGQIRQESKRGLDAYQQPSKAVVGMVSQDFWRQAFSSAIHQNEQHSDVTYEYRQDSPMPVPLLCLDSKE